MEAAEAAARPRASVSRRVAGLFTGRPRLTVGSLLAGPLGWLVIGYLGSLAILFAAAFWNVNALTGEVAQTFTLANFKAIFGESVYRSVALRTLGIAAAVTVTDAVL